MGTQLHHRTRDELHALATTLDAFLHRWEDFCAAQCARLIWRETTPQHFDTPGGLYRGKTSRGDKKIPCVPLRPAELSIATARNDAAAETLQKYPRVLRVRTSTGSDLRLDRPPPCSETVDNQPGVSRSCPCGTWRRSARTHTPSL